MKKRGRKGFADSHAFTVACTMPSGRKHNPNETFNWSDSEVTKWLVQQPTILAYLFDKCKSAGAIVYDQQTGTWHGKDSSSKVENL